MHTDSGKRCIYRHEIKLLLIMKVGISFMETKKTEKIKYPKKKMIIGIILIVLVVASYFVQYTALMRDYTFNYITKFSQLYTVNFIVIGLLLVFMNTIEINLLKKRLKDKL